MKTFNIDLLSLIGGGILVAVNTALITVLYLTPSTVDLADEALTNFYICMGKVQGNSLLCEEENLKAHMLLKQLDAEDYKKFVEKHKDK